MPRLLWQKKKQVQKLSNEKEKPDEKDRVREKEVKFVTR